MSLILPSDLNDTVERIIHSCESRETSQNESVLLDLPSYPQDDHCRKSEQNYSTASVSQSISGGTGKLTQRELEQLSLFCVTASDNTAQSISTTSSTPSKDSMDTKTDIKSVPSIWATVDLDLLSSLASLLEEHVVNAAFVDIIAEARKAFENYNSGGKTVNPDQWFKSISRNKSNGFHRMTLLRQGLEAASILIFIMTSSGVDRRVISEDSINACISLMRHHLSKNAIPALSGRGHTITFSPSSTSPSSPNRNSTEDVVRDSQQPSQWKKQKTGNKIQPAAKHSQALVKFMKIVGKNIFSSIGLLTLLMERVDLLIQAIPVDDQPLLSICSTALSSLTIIIPITSSALNQATLSLTNVLQMASLALVTTVFRQYGRHRIVILEDLFPLFLKLPTSKKSMRTFSVSRNYFGMGSRKELLSISSDNRKRRRSEIAEHSKIQVMSALILFLVQSCVTMPLPKGGEENGSGSSLSPRNDRTLPNLTSGLLECESACQFFTAQLIQRCSKKGEDGGASEFRPILTNLVEDLLNVQTVPDFPAAEMILISICRRLSYDLISNSSASSKSSVLPAEGTYLTTAMDTIGIICSDVASKIVASRENPLEFPKAVDISNLNDKANLSIDSHEVNRCFCGRTSLVDTFMLDCDRCHSWFHGTCVGVAKDNLPEVWICDECTMEMLVLEQTKLLIARCEKTGNKDQVKMGDMTEEDQVHMMKILSLNFLSHQMKATKSPNIAMARNFHLAKFINDVNEIRCMARSNEKKENVFYLDAEILCAHLMDMWHLPITDKNTVAPIQKCEYLSEEGNSKLMLTLYACQSNNLASSFPRLLGVLLNLMGDERTVSLRKLAVRAVSQVVKVNPSLMLQPKVRVAVSKRFQDKAISVREAAVTLVGIYVEQVPSLANVFHRPLTLRLNDSGISVRKRVIKIFRDLMLSNHVYSGRADACTQMLQRAADPKEDDGVRDLIHEAFQNLWFDSDNKNGMSCKTISAVVTPGSDSKERSLALPRSGSYETAKQMVEVIKASGSPEYLTSLVKDLLFGFGEGDKSSKATARKERQFNAQNHCSSIVTALIEQLITYEELRADQDTQVAASEPHLVGLISTLGVFAEASPGLLIKHLDVLLPYLKADNSVKKESEALIVLYVCKILCRVSSHLSAVDIQRLSNGALSDDLVKITYNFGSNATSAAVEALVKLASHENGNNGKLKSKVLKLTRTFFSYLTKVRGETNDFSQAKASLKSNVHRALSTLGSICRFHDKGDDDVEDTDEIFDLISTSALTLENVPTASYALFEIYINKLDTQTKCKALRAMSGIFLARPRIMLIVEQQGLIEDVMSNTSPVELQLEALVCWREILISEERRIESGEAKRQMESNERISLSNKISGDQDSDASLIGACCIQHAFRLFEMTASTHSMIRLNSLLLIETLLRQGLINPMDTVPHLLALQGDIEHPPIRTLALKLLIEENQKRPDIIRQRLASGVHRSYKFQRHVYPDRLHVTALVSSTLSDGNEMVECIFGQIFKETIRNSRHHSIRILKSLLGLFTTSNKPIDGDSSIESANKEMDSCGKNTSSFLRKIPLLCFAAEILAHLPYNHLGDILFILHHVSGSIAMEGNEFLMRFTAFLRPFDLANDDITEEDKIEKAASRKKPRKVLKAFSTSNISKFADLCAEASVMVLLLRLKLYLRKAYSGITETRMREYLPSEKERITDRGIYPSTEISRFKADIPKSFKEDGSFDNDSLIRQYCEFKSLMRSNYEYNTNEDVDQE